LNGCGILIRDLELVLFFAKRLRSFAERLARLNLSFKVVVCGKGLVNVWMLFQIEFACLLFLIPLSTIAIE
jgi:hypothetical protein